MNTRIDTTKPLGPLRLGLETLGAPAPHRARLGLQPLERGFGATLGEALRRVMLSALPGSAVTRVTLAAAAMDVDVDHVARRDLAALLLGLKGVVFHLHGRPSATVTLCARGDSPVRAGDVLTPAGVRVLNPEHVIASRLPGVAQDMQIQIEVGRGGGAGSSRRLEVDRGAWGPVMGLDVCFSPVRRVECSIEPARAARCAALDRLVLDIETNGLVTPHEALREAARMLQDSTGPSVGDRTECETPDPAAAAEAARRQAHEQAGWMRPIDDLDLTVRAANCLKAENIRLVGDLVQRTERDLLRTPHLGRRCLNEIQEALARRGLTLGATVTGWRGLAAGDEPPA